MQIYKEKTGVPSRRTTLLPYSNVFVSHPSHTDFLRNTFPRTLNNTIFPIYLSTNMRYICTTPCRTAQQAPVQHTNPMMKRKLLLVLCSAVLLSVGWLRISGIALLAALVPLLLISDSYDSSRRSFWRMAGWTALTFCLWSVATIWWVWLAAPVGVFAATIVQVVLFGAVFMFYHYTSKRCSATISGIILVSGWLAAEYIYLNGEISFPWLLLGNGFANDTWAIQWYEYTGALGGSLWVLVSNLILFHAIKRRSDRQLWYGFAAWVVIPIILSQILYWSWKEPQGNTVTVTSIQPNIEPYTEKFSLPQAKQDDIILSLAAQSPQDADFLLAPETAIDNSIWENDIKGSSSIQRYVDFIRTERPNAQFISGATTFKLYPDERTKTFSARPLRNGTWYDVYNSAIAIDSAANIAVHHKAKLVIGVEMMPFMELLQPFTDFIVDLGGTTGQLGTDNYYRTFTLNTDDGTKACSAAPICYESVYGEHFATFARRGAQVLFVLTNDGWWGDTPGYKQHFSYSRMRAIETRRYIARSANTGISGFINSRGDVLDTLGWDQRGIVTRTIPLSDETTFYIQYGDMLGRLGEFVFMLSLLYFIVYRFRRRSHLVDE